MCCFPAVKLPTIMHGLSMACTPVTGALCPRETRMHLGMVRATLAVQRQDGCIHELLQELLQMLSARLLACCKSVGGNGLPS